MKDPHGSFHQQSAASEKKFRQIFFAHLIDEGFTATDAYRLIFMTPDAFHYAPPSAHGPELLEAFREKYRQQLVHGWFFEGLERRPEENESCLQAPDKPVTFVIIPGIFGEFIETLPFQEALDRKTSRFKKKWQPALDQVSDEVFNVRQLKRVPCPLSEVVKIGSIDQGTHSFANLIVMKALGGSGETLGSLEANAEVLIRRLAKVFEAIEDDTDIYLVGYSRGLAVALELVSCLHEQNLSGEIPPASEAWFKRLRGVVGLAGVYYGANFAHQVLNRESGATSDLLQHLCDISDRLRTIPKGTKLREETEIFASNARTWGGFVKQVRNLKSQKSAPYKNYLGMNLDEVFKREGKARILGRDLPVPSPLGIFSGMNNFFLQTFNLKKFISRYNLNIIAFQKLVTAVVTGVETLTPESRDKWWRSHRLPEDLVLLSITGTMPDAFMDSFESPLWHFDGYGTRTADYNVALRSSYYDTLFSEKTMINDSQVSHFCARYWEQMYPEHQYTHHYLGVLGTHHWGIAFPYSLKDPKKIGANAFPRTILLKSLASFLQQD